VDNSRLNKIETLRQAQQLISQGRLSAAISIYKKIVDDDSSDLTAVSTLGELYVKGGRIQEAVAHYVRIAENHLSNGSTNSAGYILNKAVKLDPANATANMNLGELSLLEKKIDQAHAYFIESAAAFWQKGNIPAAIKLNKRALSIVPDSRQAITGLELLQREIDQRESPEPPPPPPPPPPPTQQKPTFVEPPPIFITIPDESNVDAPDSVKPAPDQPQNSLLGESERLWAAGPAHDSPLPAELASIDSVCKRQCLPDLDEDAVVEQIARAELLVAYGQVDQAIALLRESLLDNPDHIQIRAKLKDIYLRSEMIDRASEECVNIAAIYAARGETERAGDYAFRARLLSHSIEPIAPLSMLQKGTTTKSVEITNPDLDWNQELSQPVTVM
jgi:tetratricopeptide (TPR) repeat protein